MIAVIIFRTALSDSVSNVRPHILLRVTVKRTPGIRSVMIILFLTIITFMGESDGGMVNTFEDSQIVIIRRVYVCQYERDKE